MATCLLGYQFLGPQQPDQNKWTWRNELGIDVNIYKPFCVHISMWKYIHPTALIEILKAVSTSALDEESFDWIELLTPEGANRLNWGAVPSTGLFPLVRYADDHDVQRAINCRAFVNVSYCINYGRYDEYNDKIFSPLGYDVDGPSINLSALVNWSGVRIDGWKRKYAHNINRWHLFADFVCAQSAAKELSDIIREDDPESDPLFAVGVGLQKQVLSSLYL